MKKALIIIGIVIVIGAAAGYLFWKDYKSGVLTGDVQLAGVEYPDGGQQHIPVDSTHEPYNSNPPTSGPHYEQPAAWGVYDRELQDEQLVHNLEHGGIWISYKPDIDADTKAKIEDLGRQYPGAVIVTPRAANPHPIEVASWRRIMDMDVFDRDAIIDFIKRNKNKSPEPLAR
jgi:hypothetical protein